MSHVEFPGLGWSFDINSTAFSIGSFEIKWYGLLIATGFLLAVIYAMVMCKKMNINRSRLLDTIIVGLIASAPACIMLSFIRVINLSKTQSVFSIFMRADWAYTAAL